MEVLIGFHGTFCECIQSILTSGFTFNKRTDHWLGQGIYFYKDDEEQAKIWANSKKRSHIEYKDKPIAIIKANIHVKEERILNINLRSDLKIFTDFAKKIIKSPDITLKFDLKKAEKNRCLLYDYISHEKGYQVVLAPFSHIPGTVKEVEASINAPLGIYFCEQQICVKDQETIIKKECTFREDTPLTVKINTLKKKPLTRRK